LTYNLNKNVYKNSSASLDCVGINELCTAIDSEVAIVHENFTSHSQHQIEVFNFVRMQLVKFIALKTGKIRKSKQYEITAALSVVTARCKGAKHPFSS